MTIYEPRTELGKAIAGALMWDDSVRLEIHEILEEWEPRIEDQAWMLSVAFQARDRAIERCNKAEARLDAIRTHMEGYPDEHDNETYSIPTDLYPRFNSVLFLTHLETWHAKMVELLGPEG